MGITQIQMVRELHDGHIFVGRDAIHVGGEAAQVDDQDLRQHPRLHLFGGIAVGLATWAIPIGSMQRKGLEVCRERY
jgi:hypothetical protein